MTKGLGFTPTLIVFSRKRHRNCQEKICDGKSERKMENPRCEWNSMLKLTTTTRTSRNEAGK